MGLDIRYSSELTKANGNEAFDEYGDIRDDEGWFQVYVNYDFPERADGLEDRTAYKAKSEGHFRAGSYGGYNAWRNELAKIAGYPCKEVDRYGTGSMQLRYDQGAWEAESGPFWELINFSDCEGVIGSETSKKLAKDFADFQAKADESEDEYFKEKYKEWRKAFETASNNGVVDFR